MDMIIADATCVASQSSVSPPRTVSDAIVEMLADLGVRYAFGVSGGAIAALWGALSGSSIRVGHFRHESGAAFAAIEAHFATDAPVMVFTTTGPGLTNALTGLLAARGEGAKIILLSACTSAGQRGRWAIQETGGDTIPAGLTSAGALFHMATVVESVDALPQIARRLANGLARPGGFVCHLAIPTALQAAPVANRLPGILPIHAPVAASDAVVKQCAALLTDGPVALWLGFGARAAAERIRTLAVRLGAAVMCSPRAKGIFPDDDPRFVGVTGMGGHGSVLTYMRDHRPRRILVLGTRLGEPTSFWNPAMIPDGGFIHVDIDPDVPGVAYPSAFTLPVHADVGMFVTALLQRLPAVTHVARNGHQLPNPPQPLCEPDAARRIRPDLLMAAIQRIVIDRHGSPVFAEVGNAFTWATHSLRFREPGQYRVSTAVGAMGHCAAGVVGAALAGHRKAVALVGDGAMLMNNEINTAVKLGAPAVWIVLNDARYNMCEQGMAVLGLYADATIPEVDFAMLARSMGASGQVVVSECDLDAALQSAMAAEGPFVLDVRIDPSCLAPSMGRNRGLSAQGIGTGRVSTGVIGAGASRTEIAFPPRPDMSPEPGSSHGS
jgi:acetolactate synthase-1/2/3 large subunit